LPRPQGARWAGLTSGEAVIHEIRIHGRGGQGTVIASKILAKAFVEEGLYATAIPSFGFERRGAPVSAFLRCGDTEIRAVTNIYLTSPADPTTPARFYRYNSAGTTYELCTAQEQGTGSVTCGGSSDCGQTCNYKVTNP